MAGPSPPKSTHKPYRVYLSAALHRRFIRASFFALLVCYAYAVVLGLDKSWFWSWFPLGISGIRTLLLFLSSLCVFVLRVAQLHVGSRNTDSTFDTFKQKESWLRTFQTLGWYFLSALLFCEVYMWSAPKSANLASVKPAKGYQRAELNESPIYLRSFYFILATLQSIWHIYFDYDRVPLPATIDRAGGRSEQAPPVAVSPVLHIKTKILPLLKSIAYRTGLSAFFGPFIYWAFMRRVAWKSTVSWAKLFNDLPRSQSHATGLPPHQMYLILRSALTGFLLLFLWEASNLLFTLCASEEPLKLGRPLTDASKDPNGSLLTGLRSKKELPRTFAFWELMLISERFPDRRKAIFEGLERQGGSTWKQILAASLNVISNIKARIEGLQVVGTTRPSQNVEIRKLRAHVNPPKENNIFATPPKPAKKREIVINAASQLAVSIGSQPDWTPDVRRMATNNSLVDAVKQHTNWSKVRPLLYQCFSHLTSSPVGAPFRRVLPRRVTSIILGSPYSEITPIVDAIDSITGLLICSLNEDTYGKVQEDVPLVVRTFTSTIETIWKFVAEIEPYWSDTSYSDERRELPESVALVLARLEERLGELLGAFSLYLEDVGVKGEELAAARIAAGVEVAMIEAGR